MAPKTPAKEAVTTGLKLPVGIVGAGDLRKLSRELGELETMLQQMRLRTNAPVAKLPRPTRALEEFAATNRLNLLQPTDRKQAVDFIGSALKNAPVIHMSFAAEASRKFTTEVVMWLRTNIHTDTLLEIGLEPTIAAGCILRTANKQYDFSLRNRFNQQAGLLAQKLHGEEVAQETIHEEVPANAA